MASSYSGTVFLIDDAQTKDTMETMKGSALNAADSVYIFSGAGHVTLSGSCELHRFYLGMDETSADAGQGVLDVMTGVVLGIDGGSQGGLYIGAAGHFHLNGGPGADKVRVRNTTSDTENWILQEFRGFIECEYAQMDLVDIICDMSGDMQLTDSSIAMEMSLTDTIYMTGSLSLVRSKFGAVTDKRFGFAISGVVTYDYLSEFPGAKLTIHNLSNTLIFDDDPDEYSIKNEPIYVKNYPLGGDKASVRRIGISGRQLAVRGTFDTIPGGTDRSLTHFALLRKLFEMQDTFGIAWDEGVITKAIISGFTDTRNSKTIQERPYGFIAEECY